MPSFHTRDRTLIHYEDWGDGPAVLMLNVAMMDSRMWEYQATWFAVNGLRCVTYDRRGSGRSDRPWHGYDYSTLADDVADLIAHLDLRDVTLVGYAAGGGEAVRYLTRHGGSRVARLALVSSTTPFLMRTASNPGGVPASVFEEDVAALAADRPLWADKLVGPFFGGTVSEPLGRWFGQIALDVSPPAAVGVYRTLFETDQREELVSLSLPTLVIHGEDDLAAPLALCGRPTSELVADSTLFGHVVRPCSWWSSTSAAATMSLRRQGQPR